MDKSRNWTLMYMLLALFKLTQTSGLAGIGVNVAGQDPDPEKKTGKCRSKGKNGSQDLEKKTGR